jgi:glycosyltransferase involved in cell wall biosynthesis
VKISVIIPVRNEEQSIGLLLDSLTDQTLKPAEIVITDGGSSDTTREIVSEYVDRGAPIRLLRESEALPGRGRNLAAAQAVNEWLAFIDAGNRPSSDWLEILAREISEGSDVDVVYGSYEPVTDSFFKECAAIAYVPPPFETGSGFARPHSIVSALMRRHVWNAVGGFPENLRSAEDLLLMRQIEQANFKIARAPGAVVHWNIQPNLWRTFKRFVQYARSNIRAGLWSEWQAAILLRYALIAVTIVPAFLIGWRWLFLPFTL